MKLDTVNDINEALSDMDNVNEANKQLAFKCAQRAKAIKDLDLEFEARFAFLRQLCFLNEYEEATAIFAWFLNMCDKHPDRFEYFKVLWAFKWIIGAVNYYHKINLPQLNNLFFFYLGCYLFFKSLDQGEVKLGMKIETDNFLKPLKQNVYSVPQLAEWFAAKAIENGKLLDQRNGNDFFEKHYSFMTSRPQFRHR